MSKKPFLCRIWIHKYNKFIKAQDYDPPQLFVAGCYVCKHCGKEKWI